METQAQQQERIAKKAAATKWPEDGPVPDTPRLQLSGEANNAFFIIGRAHRVARQAGWSQAQIDAFTDVAKAGDYDHVLQTCMKYFDVA